MHDPLLFISTFKVPIKTIDQTLAFICSDRVALTVTVTVAVPAVLSWPLVYLCMYAVVDCSPSLASNAPKLRVRTGLSKVVLGLGRLFQLPSSTYLGS